MSEPRWRDIAGGIGRIPPGPLNSITDVPGVLVGHSQAASGEKTGVTIVSPPTLPSPASTISVNGVGELTGNLEVNERGLIETPVYLCGSHAIGTVLQAAIIASARGPENVVLPVVGECDDGELADSRTVVAADVERARGSLKTAVSEGTVGAGTGMNCFDFPGGIGTASRQLDGYRVGVLLLCNFGDREYLDIPGGPLEPAVRPAVTHGSCIAVCATDAPLSSQQLHRLALRPLLGLARAGSFAAEGSGEIGISFSTGDGSGISNGDLNPLFAAAWEAAHEAVYNCLAAARPSQRLDGTYQDAFPIELIRQAAGG